MAISSSDRLAVGTWGHLSQRHGPHHQGCWGCQTCLISFAQIHNTNNENAWGEVLKWERFHKAECPEPQVRSICYCIDSNWSLLHSKASKIQTFIASTFVFYTVSSTNLLLELILWHWKSVTFLCKIFTSTVEKFRWQGQRLFTKSKTERNAWISDAFWQVFVDMLVCPMEYFLIC